MATVNPTPTDGHLGHLTTDQEYKLKEFWSVIYTFFGIAKGLKVGGKPPAPEKKAGRFGFGGKTVTNEEAYKEAIQSFKTVIGNVDLTKLRQKMEAVVAADDPDRLALRFLRARKWDLPRATEMFGKTLRWRTVDEDVEEMLLKGDIHWVENEPDTGFIQQYRDGKSVIAGHDKFGRPVIRIQVAKHNPKNQSDAAMRRYTLFNMEEARRCLGGDIETCVVIFDLGGFGLHNMDYEVVKFIIQCFEAHYPESLGYLLIHRAPRVFGVVWAAIKGWIDPVVASKISFTKDDKDLLKIIDSDQLYKELGGTNTKEYHWSEPNAEYNRPLLDDATREKLMSERTQIFEEFNKYTVEWIQADGQASKNLDAKRREIAKQIETNFWQLDPYIRARCGYDRSGDFGHFRKELAPGGVAQPVITEADVQVGPA